MFEVFKRKREVQINSPAKGILKDISESEDEVFSSKTLGEGFFVRSSDHDVYSPASGVITSVFPTHHAIGFKTSEGIEILIHIGVNTSEIKDEIIKCDLNKGRTIKAREKIAEIDIPRFISLGISPDIYVLIVNPNNYLIKNVSNKENESVGIEDIILLCKKE